MKSLDKDPNKIRLQVFLSRNGVCSRRRAFEIIVEGQVSLNGKVTTEPSVPVHPTSDHVSVDGKTVRGKKFTYIMLNKPPGFTTTKSDKNAKKMVIQLLPKKFQHLSPVGRLDKDSEGLLLLTNDGDTAYCLTHPKHQVDKVYFVRVIGRLDVDKKKKVEGGVYIDGKKTAPAKIKNMRCVKSQTELKITIHEGRKRQVRYMFSKIGHKVVYLKRIVQGPMVLGGLKSGTWRMLNNKEIEQIKSI